MKATENKQEAKKTGGAACVYAVVELEQENNKEKQLIDTVVFANRDDALVYLHGRYDAARLDADSGSGELSADYSEDGWYSVVNGDGDKKEGYLSAGLEVRGVNRTDALCVLNRVHDFLGGLCRDGRCDDHCHECIGASDLADDVWDVIHGVSKKEGGEA
jgi:hypothetical protein